MFSIEDELKKLPAKPGVYLMHDKQDNVIYVGKAKKLKNRVRQYFQIGRSKGFKIDQMVSRIVRFEYIVTDSEVEALVLECNLIKEHRPKYNTMLMDDKSYPFIKVTLQESFPRIMLARRITKDGSKYFGPYLSGHAVGDTIALLQKLFYIRNCNRNLPKDLGKERPCLYYEIKQCNAPCQGYVTTEEYGEKVSEMVHFLNGNHEEILADLTERMENHANALEYEKAMECRDLIKSVKKISQKQKITETDVANRDVVAVALENEDAVAQVFFIRGGRLIGRDHFYLKVGPEDTIEMVLSGFIKQFYSGTPFIPANILLQENIADKELIEEWLSNRRGAKVHLVVPQKGKKEKLVELAYKNATQVLTTDKERIKREEGRTIGALKELNQYLDLESVSRIEAYDISNISGFHSVGSMIVYEDGKPKKADYRKFLIKGVEGPDDYASLKEVITRRFKHGMKERQEGKEFGGFTRFPDLIMMDGGKGQMQVCQRVLDELSLEIPVCGMVKDDKHRTRGLYFKNEEIKIPANSEAFRLITRIQDEAHRFAITFHKSLRGKEQVHSVLDEIKGIGKTRRKEIMRHFKGIEEVKAACVEELAKIPSMNEKSAKEVYNFFHGYDILNENHELGKGV